MSTTWHSWLPCGSRGRTPHCCRSVYCPQGFCRSSPAAEVAFAVADTYQGRGIGTLNPVDMIASATPELYRQTMAVVGVDPSIDALGSSTSYRFSPTLRTLPTLSRKALARSQHINQCSPSSFPLVVLPRRSILVPVVLYLPLMCPWEKASERRSWSSGCGCLHEDGQMCDNLIHHFLPCRGEMAWQSVPHNQPDRFLRCNKKSGVFSRR